MIKSSDGLSAWLEGFHASRTANYGKRPKAAIMACLKRPRFWKAGMYAGKRAPRRWSATTLFSWFRVQNKPYHCTIRYMVVVLAR